MVVVFPDDFHPEFAEVDPAVAAFWVDAAACAIDAGRWACAGCDPNKGIVLKASHLMKEAGLGTGAVVPAGSIISEARGGKSVSRATGAGATGEHGSTVYGLALDNILTRIGNAPRRMPPPPQPSC